MPAFSSDPNLQEACRILFGRTLGADQILRELKPSELKAAFRSRALATHPDRSRVLGQEIACLHEEFLRVVGAYQVVKEALARPQSAPMPEPPRGRAWTPPPPPPPRPRGTTGKAQDYSAGRSASERPGTQRYYHGDPPFRVLRIGEFVYYSGLISWGDLIAALIWQKNQRPTFGSVAVAWKLMTEDQVRDVLACRGFGERFGECAVRKGFLSSFWVRTIILHQAKQQCRLGDYFQENGLVTAEQMGQCLADLKLHNRAVTRARH